MRILNLYFSSTGNTERVARTIEKVGCAQGHEVETVRISGNMETDPDVTSYDFVFAGSGVYDWLPGKPLMELFSKLIGRYRDQGIIQAAAPRRPGNKVVVYCTFGGCHTGVNEALPALMFMGQLFDHLGFTILGEWTIVGEYNGRLKELSLKGRLGNIEGHPNEEDLCRVAEQVQGALLA